MDQDSKSAPAEASAKRRIEGFVDAADWTHIRGWACYAAAPSDDPEASRAEGGALWLEVIVDDAAAVAFFANMLRDDLALLHVGDGRFGFNLRFPQPLDPNVAHEIIIRVRDDGTMLPNAPVRLARAPMAALAARASFEAAVAAEIEAAGVGPELDETLGFLLRQAESLLQARADLGNGSRQMLRFRMRWSDYLDGERAAPPQPDPRPWVLVVDTELPDEINAIGMVTALQALGYRVAVTATRDLAATGALALSLRAMRAAVLGMPEHYTVEDVLRRNRAQFRAVVLRGAAVAAGYGVVARMHQPRARIVAVLGDPPRDRSDGLLNLGSALMADVVVVETADAAALLGKQLPGRAFQVIAPGADGVAMQAGLIAAGIVSQVPRVDAGAGVSPAESRDPA